MRSWVRRTAAALVGLVTAIPLTACLSEPKPAEPDRLEASTVEDLGQGCKDIQDGYPKAAKYTGAGPHPVAVFTKGIVGQSGGQPTYPPDYELANSEASDGVLALSRSPADVQLLACGIARPGTTLLGSCAYTSAIGPLGNSVDIPQYSQRYQVTVYELRTGRVVDTLELESGIANCPSTFGGGQVVYAPAQPFELDELLTDLATGPAA
jgi:hypothetical protein